MGSCLISLHIKIPSSAFTQDGVKCVKFCIFWIFSLEEERHKKCLSVSVSGWWKRSRTTHEQSHDSRPAIIVI